MRGQLPHQAGNRVSRHGFPRLRQQWLLHRSSFLILSACVLSRLFWHVALDAHRPQFNMVAGDAYLRASVESNTLKRLAWQLEATDPIRQERVIDQAQTEPDDRDASVALVGILFTLMQTRRTEIYL